METLLKDLTLDELIFYYQRAQAWQKMLKEDHPNIRYAIGKETDIDAIRVRITMDLHRLWIHMIAKIPETHLTEIKKLSTL